MKIQKSIALLVVTLLVISTIASFTTMPSVKAIQSTTGGPDNFGYTYIDSNTTGGPTYNWIEITGTGTNVTALASSDDLYVVNMSLGFFFNFYGTDYSQITIGNNGILFSNYGSSQYTNQPIPTSVIEGFIAPFWDDLVTWSNGNASADGSIFYQTLGTAPNRMFVVEWYNNQHYSSSPSGITFEAILYEGSDNILFQYNNTDFGNTYYDNGASATVGIESPDGTTGLQYSYNQPVITPGLAILFKFPAFVGTDMYLTMNGPASMDHGNTATYTLFYNNFGSDNASNVLLQAALSLDVIFVSASNEGTYDSNTGNVTWDLGTVQNFPLGRNSTTFTVLIPDNVSVGTIIENNATISTTTLETRYDDNSAFVQTRVTGSSLPPNVSVGPLNGNSGTTPTVYWGNSITFNYTDPLYGTAESAYAVDITIHLDDGNPDIVDNMTGPSSTGVWNYTITFLSCNPPRHGEATVTYTPHRPNQTQTVPIQFTIYIDPSGYVYDVTSNLRISGATVWLQQLNSSGVWVNVLTGQSPAIMDPDTNPEVTGIDGQYQWDVLPGSYRIHVEAPGYYPADSIVVNIPPPVTDLQIGLTHLPDNTPPVTNLTIGNPKVVSTGQIFVNASTPFTLSAQDNANGSGVAATSYEISNATYDSGQINYSSTFFMTGLSDGTYTLNYNSTDYAGNNETVNNQTIVIDNTPPHSSNNYDNTWHTSDFTVNLTATDTGCGVNATYYKVNNGSVKNLAVDGQPTINTESANNQIEYWSVDNLGQQEIHNILSAVKLDKTAPTGSIIINNGSNSTSSTSVTLTLTANDTTSGIAYIRFSNNGTWTNEQWQPFTSTKTWTLPSGDGTKTVYFQIQDNAGLNSSTYSATINFITPAPSQPSIPIYIYFIIAAAVAIVLITTMTFLVRRKKSKAPL